MLKPYVPTSPEVVKASFRALVQLEKSGLLKEAIRREDDVSFNRARNELYGIVDENGYTIEWKERQALLKKGTQVVLSSEAP